MSTAPENNYGSLFKGKREIDELSVKCHNTIRGCEWVGTVGTLVKHVALCEFTLLHCPNNCKDHDGKTMQCMRKDLTGHQNNSCPNRRYTCQYCGKEGTYARITEIHDRGCPRKPISCANTDCTLSVERRALKRHREVCEFTEIACKFSTLGCEVKKMRKDMVEHEVDDSSHLHMAIETVAVLRQSNTKLKADYESIAELRQSTTKFKADYESVQMTFTSPPFYTSPGGYCMTLHVCNDEEEDSINVFVSSERGDNDDDLKWPFLGDVSVTLLNQLENKNHYKKIFRIKPEHAITPGNNVGFDFISEAALGHNPVKNTQYLKDDALYFKVSVDIPGHRHWLDCTV